MGTIIIHHDDMDGIMSAMIVATYYRNSNHKNFRSYNYRMELPLDRIDDNETVYIVDVGLNERNIKELYNFLMARENVVVVYIDHHSSSVELLQADTLESQRIRLLPGVVTSTVIDAQKNAVKVCGAVLTYSYLYANEYKVSKTPDFLEYVNEWDCWLTNEEGKFLSDPETIHFKLGFDTCGHKFEKWSWGLMGEIDKTNINGAMKTKMQLLETGRQIKEYVEQKNQQMYEQFSYVSKLTAIINDNVVEYDCIAINDFNNSWVFGNAYHKYPLCVTYVFDGTMFNYTLYSNDTSIDCSAIASSYGGGGHKSVAGFSHKELLLKKL